MPSFEQRGVRIHYEEYGQGFPLLLLAPGGMRSNATFWQRTPFDPTQQLAQQFRVIAMDQRNAGQSFAPITAEDGWHSYAADQLALSTTWVSRAVMFLAAASAARSASS
jgi:pimeloyl-ACP methyl ester carboxylesterase